MGWSRRRVALGWLAVFVAALGLYALTASRGAQWQDSGDRALRIYLHEVRNPMGLALAHPLHHWLGRLALKLPGLEPVCAITLVSALAGALAAANVFGCVATAVRNLPAAGFAAGSLALAHTVWQLATITEVYTVSAALFAAECWCLVAFARGGGRWALWGMLLFNGVGVANHLQAGLTTPVLAVVAVLAWRGRRVGMGDMLAGAGLWLTGTLPYAALVAAEYVQSGDLGGTLRSALFGRSWAGSVLNTQLSRRLLVMSVAFPLFNFPNLLWPAAAYGMAKARAMGISATARRALLAALAVHAVFVLRYNIVDQYMFFLPAYVLASVFGGVGAAAVGRWESPRRRRMAAVAAAVLLALTPTVYWGSAAVLRRYHLLRTILHHSKPYRDEYQYVLVPWSVTERSAERMSREAVALAGEGGLILMEDGMARFAVEYRALRSGAVGVEMHVLPAGGADRASLLRRAGERAADGKRVVLIPLDRDRVGVTPPLGRWARKGDLYVLDVGELPTSMGAAVE